MPHLTTYIFLSFPNEPELGAEGVFFSPAGNELGMSKERASQWLYLIPRALLGTSSFPAWLKIRPQELILAWLPCSSSILDKTRFGTTIQSVLLRYGKGGGVLFQRLVRMKVEVQSNAELHLFALKACKQKTL